MKGFDVLNIKSAVKSRNKFDLSKSHLTTMDFGQIVPLCVFETVPGDKFNIKSDYFSRLAPLVKPTYGKFQFKTVSGFVPYHQIAYDSDAWLAGKTSFEGQTPHHRYITKSELALFIYYCTTGTGATAQNCDYAYFNSSGVAQYRLFTPAGKYYVKVLNALGYTVPQGIDDRTTSYWMTVDSKVKLSAYPLLAFFKMYNDYMSQSQRFNTSALSNLLLSIKNGVSHTGWSNTTGAINSTGLNMMFSNLYLNYDNDYFTSAWQSANNPLASPDSQIGIDVPASAQNAVVNQTTADTVLMETPGTPFTLGQRALDFLKSFDDWVRRNNFSGSRSVQQIYSRFGIKTDDYRSHYAHIVSTDSMPIQVGDVTATADSTNVPLGDYAGKGIMSGSKDISFDVSDYGLIIIMGYFTVTPMNPYGFDRMVLRTSPLDYYNPEFDGLGADAISLSEYYESPIANAIDSDTTQSNAVFGFTERYNSYRFGRDVITGEFRNYRNDADMNTWHTGRNMSAIRKAGNLVAQSGSVNTLEQSGSQYNRMFSVTSDTVDHFYLTARFEVSAIRPMLNLNQVVRLGEGDTAVPRNGNVIS